MIKQIFFKVMRILVFFKTLNMKVVKTTEYSDGTRAWDYSFGSAVYRSVGAEPKEPPYGVFYPIIKAECEGQDVTKQFMRYAGPKCNHVPDTGFIFFKRIPTFKWSIKGGGLRLEIGLTKQKGPSKEVVVTNLLGQISVFGAK